MMRNAVSVNSYVNVDVWCGPPGSPSTLQINNLLAYGNNVEQLCVVLSSYET